MEFSVILNYILGGGLLAAVIGVVTMKATVAKANAEAEKAKEEANKARAEAEGVRIDNTEHATRILLENIVEPLKKELSETREELRETKKEFGSTKREMARFRKAVESANGCKFRMDCPVLSKLRDNQANKQPDGDTPGAYGNRQRVGVPRERNDPTGQRDGAASGRSEESAVCAGGNTAGTGDDGPEDTELP